MILLVEDEPMLREVEAAYLQQADYQVIEAVSGAEALAVFNSHTIELIVLDINLPGLDGLQVVRRVRERSQVPIIMVTARRHELDELAGFKLGADDYLKKPFNPNVLVARVNALLRRKDPKELRVPPFVMNSEKLSLTKSGHTISLTAMQFSLLHKLMERPGVVLSREQLIDAAHEGSYATAYIFDRTIDAHIKAIRQKIEDDPARPQYIQTIYGRGYRFNEKNHA